MLVSCDQNAGQNRNVIIEHKSSENVIVHMFGKDSDKSEFESEGNQKRRLNSGIAC
jgi:hypothetical protein